MMSIKASDSDAGLYIAQHEKSNTYNLVYVDDILIAAKDMAAISIVKERLTTVSDVRDLGEAKYFLGMSLNRTEQSIHRRCLRGGWHQS